MDLRDAIRSRRSVKNYDPNHQISDDELKDLIGHAALAPTSYNMQNYHITIARDPEVKKALCAAAWNQSQVKEASVVLVISGDIDAYKNHSRYLRKAPEEAQAALAPMIEGAYGGRDELQRDEACRTAGFVGQNIMLMAKEMGYESCPMIGYNPVKVAEIIGLDEKHPPVLMIVVGKGTRPARPRPGLLDFDELTSLDKFGQPGLTGEIDDS